MLKTYTITSVFSRCALRIEAFESDERVLDIFINDLEVKGACKVLDELGYKCTKREY